MQLLFILETMFPQKLYLDIQNSSLNNIDNDLNLENKNILKEVLSFGNKDIFHRNSMISEIYDKFLLFGLSTKDNNYTSE